MHHRGTSANKKDRSAAFINGLAAFTEWLAGMRIMAAPAVVGAIAGWLVYAYLPSVVTLIAGCAICLSGILIGWMWLKKLRRKRSAVEFMARVNAVPELSKADE